MKKVYRVYGHGWNVRSVGERVIGQLHRYAEIKREREREPAYCTRVIPTYTILIDKAGFVT